MEVNLDAIIENQVMEPETDNSIKIRKDGQPSLQGQGGGAAPGEKRALKFKTPESRAVVYKDLIYHLERGKDRESFRHCDWQTVEKYIEDFPEEFPIGEIEEARRQGRLVIEDLLEDIATGDVKGNAHAAIFLAKNKLGYRDRKEISTNEALPGIPMDPSAPIGDAKAAIAAYEQAIKDG